MVATVSAAGLDDPVLPVGLLLLLDSRSPAGAHSHSGGMEAAVTAGFVSDLATAAEFCSGRVQTAGRVAGAFAAAACRGWAAGWSAERWAGLDAEYSARTPSPAMRSSSRALGNGLRRLLRATVPGVDLRAPFAGIPAPAPHQPLVLGVGCALLGGGPRAASRAAVLGIVTASASAAVRLLGLDPYAVHGFTVGLGPLIESVADSASVEVPDEFLPTDSAPALDILADVHLTQEVRLFAS